MRTTLTSGLIVLALGLAIGCGAAEDEPAPAPEEAEAKPEAEAADRIADFTATDLEGNERKLSELAKEKVLVLKLGTTWCSWCNKQAKVLDAFADDYAEKPLVVVEVYIQESIEKVKKHLDGETPAYTVLVDPGDEVARLFKVEGIPVVMVTDKEGKLVYTGFFTKREKLDEVVKDLLE